MVTRGCIPLLPSMIKSVYSEIFNTEHPMGIVVVDYPLPASLLRI